MVNLGSTGEERRKRVGWNSSNGDFKEVEHEGTAAHIQTLFASLREGANVIDVEIWNEGAKWKLRCTFGALQPGQDDQSPKIDIRMAANRVHKSILEAPYVRDTITLEDVQKIRKSQTWARFASPALTNNDALRLYFFTLMGVDSRTVYQPVLQVSKIAQAGHAWPRTDNSVGRIFSHDQLIADAQIAGRLNFTLPATGSSEWEGLVYRKGWLKHQPHYDTAAGGRSVEHTEWEFGLWPEYLYPPI